MVIWSVCHTGHNSLSFVISNLLLSQKVLESDAKSLRNVMLKSVKNLRSQVCRAAIQAVQVVFLNIGKTLESDSDSLVKELLQKSSDTNKFIRYMISLSCVIHRHEFILEI